MQQERAEFVAEPERAIVRFTRRLDVEVAAGQQPPFANRWIHRNAGARIRRQVGDHRKVDVAIRIAQRDERLQTDSSGPPHLRAEVRLYPIQPQHIVR